MSKCNVYLSGVDGCYIKNTTMNYPITWRKLVEEWINKYGDNMKAINPYNYYKCKDNFHKIEEEVRHFLLYKISKCDVLLVNLDHIKDSINTLNEIFFATAYNIPVIGFYEWGDDNECHGDDRYKTEPWILDACHRIETNETTALTDALIYIRNYFAM